MARDQNLQWSILLRVEKSESLTARTIGVHTGHVGVWSEDQDSWGQDAEEVMKYESGVTISVQCTVVILVWK